MSNEQDFMNPPTGTLADGTPFYTDGKILIIGQHPARQWIEDEFIKAQPKAMATVTDYVEKLRAAIDAILFWAEVPQDVEWPKTDTCSACDGTGTNKNAATDCDVCEDGYLRSEKLGEDYICPCCEGDEFIRADIDCANCKGLGLTCTASKNILILGLMVNPIAAGMVPGMRWASDKTEIAGAEIIRPLFKGQTASGPVMGMILPYHLGMEKLKEKAAAQQWGEFSPNDGRSS